MVKQIKSFICDESGATAIEYGLIAALIAVAIIVGLNTVGVNLQASFSRTANCLGTNGVVATTC